MQKPIADFRVVAHRGVKPLDEEAQLGICRARERWAPAVRIGDHRQWREGRRQHETYLLKRRTGTALPRGNPRPGRWRSADWRVRWVSSTSSAEQPRLAESQRHADRRHHRTAAALDVEKANHPMIWVFLRQLTDTLLRYESIPSPATEGLTVSEYTVAGASPGGVL